MILYVYIFVCLYCRSETTISGGDIFHVSNLSASDLTSVIDECSPSHLDSLSRKETFFDCLKRSADMEDKFNGCENERVIVVDNALGVIVVHPDTLITPTKIADAVTCMRKVVLLDRWKGLDGGVKGKAAVLGNLKHGFIEVCAKRYINRIY